MKYVILRERIIRARSCYLYRGRVSYPSKWLARKVAKLYTHLSGDVYWIIRKEDEAGVIDSYRNWMGKQRIIE